MSKTPKEEQPDTKPVKNDPPIKPKNSKSVAIYLVILFAAAFFLLLMAYFQQQRTNNHIESGEMLTCSIEEVLPESPAGE